MSMEHTVKMKCENCGKESDFTIWQSLNTTLNPEQKNKVLDGSLFKFTCPYCKESYTICYDFLYHQMEDEIMIYCITDNDEESINEAKNAFSHDITNMFQNTLDIKKEMSVPPYKKRIVNSYNSLREKIKIFDCGLDDRVIEILKFLYIIQNDKVEFDEIFFDKMDSDFGVLLFLQDGKPIGAFEIDEKNYKIVNADFNELIEKMSQDVFQIDLIWAKSVVIEKGKQLKGK